MASGESSFGGNRFWEWFRQCLLVAVTVGLEASVTLEVIFMIANIQTLGVPIRYSSLPGTISAALGVFLIPAMGFVMDRWAKSKSGKAMIMIGTCLLEILGNVLIFTANVIKLVNFDDAEGDNTSTTLTWPNTTKAWIVTNFSTTNLAINTSEYSLFSQANTTISMSTTTNWVSQRLKSSGVTSASISQSHFSNVQETVLSEETPVQYFAILAMIGYCLLDCGYDSSNCFLKTFALASTSPRNHASIISKAVFVSSFGGCLIAVLGSVGLGSHLTAGTTHDGSAAQSAFVAALCFLLLLCGLATTLTTGFCCRLDDTVPEMTSESSSISATSDEKTSLIISHDSARDTSSSPRLYRKSQDSPRNFLEKSLSGRFSGHALTSKTSTKKDQSEVLDHVVLSSRSGILGIIIREKKQILINLFAFFMLGALYSFEVYAVNFVGDGIYRGDPLAPVGSEPYQNYLRGIEVGSQGTLIYYLTFTVGTSVHELVLNRLGWKLEVLVVSVVYVVVNLLCALTVSLWAYYLCAVWTGIYRTVVVTVPYILANKFGGGKDSGVVIAIVAAMLPLGFSVCSAVMGPLIDTTGNAATPLYYTAVATFLGIIAIVFLKDD